VASDSIVGILAITMVLCNVPGPFLPGSTACAQEQEDAVSAPAPPPDLDYVLDQLIRSDKNYDEAGKILEGIIEDASSDVAVTQKAYLALVEMYITSANDQESQGNDFLAGEMRKSAVSTVEQCLDQPRLRYTRADTTAQSEVQELFARVRAKKFGSLTVSVLQPPQAVVTLDGEPLPLSPATGLPADESIYANREYTIEVRADGYQPIVEKIEILPGTAYDRPYELEKKKPWWRQRAVILPVVALATAGVVLGVSGGGSPAAEEPLLGPPQPPGQ
jgi:hypothetical protein